MEKKFKLPKTPACGLHCIKIKNFGVKLGIQTIIEDVNIHVHCGEITAIIGRNGAGKSTLVKAINGDVSHDGSIEFKDKKNGTVGKLKIGYVPQNINISKNTPTSVYDLFGSYISKIPVFLMTIRALHNRIEKHLALFEAEDLIDKAVCDLSGGELQRVLLSLAVVPVPNLLLLDEPVSGIDKNGMDIFFKNLLKLKKKYDLAIILVSHDLDYVAKYADNVILLDKTVVNYGKPKEVFESKEFKEIFGNIKYENM